MLVVLNYIYHKFNIFAQCSYINKGMLTNTSFVIFGFPRSGTKLLANILEQQGYYNFGEFFDTFASYITDDLIAKRLPTKDQIEIFNKIHENSWEELFKHHILLEDRILKFKPYANKPNSTVTIHRYPTELSDILFDLLNNRHFLCTRRKNKLEQLLSRILTYNFKNYNEEFNSQKMSINLSQFDRFFFDLKNTEKKQDYIISIGRGTIIDFDQLILGQIELGFNYKVTTTDQHKDLKSLILNYDEISNRFKYLSSKY
jgi:hypothetical protein